MAEKRQFSPDEIEFLKNNHNSMSTQGLANHIGCSWNAVDKELKRLDLKPYQGQVTWTAYDDYRLQELAGTCTIDEACVKLDKAKSTVRTHAKKLNIKFLPGRKFWTPEQILFLQENWANKSMRYLKKELKWSEDAIIRMARKLNLGPVYESTEDIPLQDFANATGISRHRILRTLAPQYNFPLKTMKPGRKQIYYYVDMAKILKWLERHQDLYDASIMPLHYFGEEPEWLVLKRKKDRVDKSHIRSKSIEQRWTEAEAKRACDLLHTGMDYHQIAAAMGKTYDQVKRKLNRMGEGWQLSKYWQGEDFRYIRDNYQTMTDAEMAEKLNRPTGSVTQHRVSAGYRKHDLRPAAVENAEKYVSENWQDMTDKQMAEKLSRSVNGIKTIRARLGLKRGESNQVRKCTDADRDYIRENWEAQTDEEMAANIRKSVKSVQRLRKKMGLERG